MADTPADVTLIRFEVVVNGDRRIVEISKPETVRALLDSQKSLGPFLRGVAGLLPKDRDY